MLKTIASFLFPKYREGDSAPKSPLQNDRKINFQLTFINYLIVTEFSYLVKITEFSITEFSKIHCRHSIWHCPRLGIKRRSEDSVT